MVTSSLTSFSQHMQGTFLAIKGDKDGEILELLKVFCSVSLTVKM